MTRALLALLFPLTAFAQAGASPRASAEMSAQGTSTAASRDGGTLPRIEIVLSDGGSEELRPLDGGLVTAEWLVLRGNKVLNEEIYRAMLKLPDDAAPDDATALAVHDQIEQFLHLTGYELGSAEVHVTDGGIDVFIDEGQLEKVVFRGRQSLDTIRFKLALDIPHDVFNRPDIERQVQKLEKELGITGLRMRLVPSTDVKHMGPQLEQMPEVKGFELLHARRSYELHFVLPDSDWETGLGADLRLGYLDGLELRGQWFGRSGIFSDDRWRMAAWVAGALRNHLISGSLYPHFTRTSFDGAYYFPAITGSGTLRPAIMAEASLLSRQRRDLNLVDYYASVLSAAVWMEWQPRTGIRIQFGGGVYDRRIFSLLPLGPITAPPPLQPGVYPEAATRPFTAIRLDFTFDPENERWDRHHILLVDFMHQFPGIGAGALAWTKLYYRYVQPFGWHDLWVRAQGFAVWYSTSFHDEASLGEHLHGVFANEFVRRAASINFEFRFSITRDLLKISAQSEIALYTAVDRNQDRGPLNMAVSFGPGLHMLLEGMFQLDVYVTFGLRPNWLALLNQSLNLPPPTTPYDTFGVAASLNLSKAF